jgi:hypothetical protein
MSSCFDVLIMYLYESSLFNAEKKSLRLMFRIFSILVSAGGLTVTIIVSHHHNLKNTQHPTYKLFFSVCISIMSFVFFIVCIISFRLGGKSGTDAFSSAR